MSGLCKLCCLQGGHWNTRSVAQHNAIVVNYMCHDSPGITKDTAITFPAEHSTFNFLGQVDVQCFHCLNRTIHSGSKWLILHSSRVMNLDRNPSESVLERDNTCGCASYLVSTSAAHNWGSPSSWQLWCQPMSTTGPFVHQFCITMSSTSEILWVPRKDWSIPMPKFSFLWVLSIQKAKLWVYSQESQEHFGQPSYTLIQKAC